MGHHEMQWSSATPGLLIILVDQSGSMSSDYDGNDSKIVFATKAVNRVIDTIIQKNYDGESPKNRCFISVIGYNNEVKVLTSGYLKELDANTIRVDTVKKKQPDGAGGLIDVDYKMPIWLDPSAGGVTDMNGAFVLAQSIISKWIKDKPNSPAPIIINISDGAPFYNGQEPDICMKQTIGVAKSIMSMSVADGNVLIFNALIKASGNSVAFPNSIDECTCKEAKFLFEISSPIPEAYKAIAKAKELTIKDGSKGCIFEADGVQLTQLIDFGS
ncbi:MAG: hypothetical protein ACI31C_03945, partial [Muribaculaceae bacterium]